MAEDRGERMEKWVRFCTKCGKQGGPEDGVVWRGFMEVKKGGGGVEKEVERGGW